MRLRPGIILTCVAATTAPSLPAELDRIDAAAGRATAVSATFRQEKYTPLLKRPLVSSGRVVSRGDLSIWTTLAPHRSTMRVTPAEIRIYYPDQHVVETYPVQGQLGALVATPLPRLATLRRFFAFAALPSTDDALSVELTPTAADLQQHVRSVRVTLDRNTGAIRQAETTDADGERTVLTFAAVDLHAAVTDADLTLTVPPGTRESHPLAGLGK